MGEYSKFIAKERRTVETPKSMVKEDRTCVFGTFNKEFEDMDILKLNHPTHAPNFLNKSSNLFSSISLFPEVFS